MLFAAGFGTRMGSLTAAHPKPLVQVAGRALIDHALDQVLPFNPDTIVANLHYRPKQIKDHLSGLPVQFSLETPEILETGGGLRAALPILGDDPVFTMNTDAVWRGPNALSILAQAWQPDHMDALLLCIPPKNAVGHAGTGDFAVASDGTAQRGPGAVYSGLQIIKTDRLSQITNCAFSLNLLWDAMLRDSTLHAAIYPGHWCDVGTPEGITLAETMLEQSNV